MVFALVGNRPYRLIGLRSPAWLAAGLLWLLGPMPSRAGWIAAPAHVRSLFCRIPGAHAFVEEAGVAP